MTMRFGVPELAIILVIVLLVFGAGKLPQVGSSLGKAIHAFRRGTAGEDAEKETEKPASSPTKS
jgi:sec-independent protein translocase protein TatA